MSGNTLQTEVRGLDLSLADDFLLITRAGEDVVFPVLLNGEQAERLRLEMAKAQLPEWNQLQELKTRAAARNRRYLGSWFAMCLAGFSAFLSYPEYFLCVALSLLSLFLWWRAGYMERQAEREAQALRKTYRPEWSYLEERMQETNEKPALS